MSVPDPHLEQREALKDLNALARTDLTSVWPTLAQGSPQRLREGLYDVLPAIGDQYGDAAASLAGDYYENLRDSAEAKGSFSPLLAEAPDSGRWGALSGWATQPLFDDPGDRAHWAVAMEKVAGGLQRTIADQHRLTVVGSSLADPQSKGWRRVGIGKSCSFCSMLLDRGEVYKDTTVTFRSHDRCNCSAAPAFSNVVAPPRIFATGLADKTANRIEAKKPASIGEN